MALVVGTNSFVSVAEADTYLADRVGANQWFTLPDTAGQGEDSKESFLVTAYYWLIGATIFSISPGETTDDNLKTAQIEAALYLFLHYCEHEERMALQAQGVQDFSASKRKEKYVSPAGSGFPLNIQGFLSAYKSSTAFFDLKGQYDV